VAYNTACSPDTGMSRDPFIPTKEVSTKVFIVATGYNTPGSIVLKLIHQIHKLAWTVDIISGLRDQSLIIARIYFQR
jgi:hypothetical protein